MIDYNAVELYYFNILSKKYLSKTLKKGNSCTLIQIANSGEQYVQKGIEIIMNTIWHI